MSIARDHYFMDELLPSLRALWLCSIQEYFLRLWYHAASLILATVTSL